MSSRSPGWRRSMRCGCCGRRCCRCGTGRNGPAIWARLLAEGTIAMAGTAEERGNTGMRGSNALAIAASRSATGSPWLAGDAHLPLTLPSVWLAAGVSLAVLQSRRADVPGIAGHVYRPQPASRLGRHQSAGGQQRVVRCLRIAVPGDPRAPGTDRRALVASARDCAARHGITARSSPTCRISRPSRGRRWRCAGSGIVPRTRSRRCSRSTARRTRPRSEKPPRESRFPVRTCSTPPPSGQIGRVSAAWLPRRGLAPPADLVSFPAASAAWGGACRRGRSPGRARPAGGVHRIREQPAADAGCPDRLAFRAARARRAADNAAPEARADRARRSDRAAERCRDGERRAAARPALRQPDPVPRTVRCSRLWPAGTAGYETGSAGALAFELVAARLIERFVPRRERAMLGAVRHGIELLGEQLDNAPPEQVAAALRTRLPKPARSSAGSATGAAPIAFVWRIRWPGSRGSASRGAAPGAASTGPGRAATRRC